MLGLLPNLPAGRALTVLAIGAHSDDIEIGCGGTLLRLADELPDIHVVWVLLSASGQRAAEARSSAEAFLGDVSHEVRLGDFRDAFFPHEPGVKEFYEDLKSAVSPDLVLVHTRDDLHQDHRVACELAWNTYRDHTILEYEIPKYDGDFGSPNVFVAVSESQARRKSELLIEHFGTQRDKDWFKEDVFLSLMRLRGMECRAASGFAEAFYGRKLKLEPSSAR